MSPFLSLCLLPRKAIRHAHSEYPCQAVPCHNKDDGKVEDTSHHGLLCRSVPNESNEYGKTNCAQQ